MPVVTRTKAPGDQSGSPLGSFTRELINIGGTKYAQWEGFATVPASTGVAAASLAITTASPQRTQSSLLQMTIPAGAYIKSVSFRVPTAVTLGAATGKLKLAGGIQDGATLSASSAAAVSNALAATTDPVRTYNPAVSSTELLGSDTEFRIFATDGAAVGSEAASTVISSTTEEIKIIVAIAFEIPGDFPTLEQVLELPPEN